MVGAQSIVTTIANAHVQVLTRLDRMEQTRGPGANPPPVPDDAPPSKKKVSFPKRKREEARVRLSVS